MKRAFERVVWCGLFSVLLMPAAARAQENFKPTKEHEGLADEKGVWDAECQFWMTPDAEPVKSKGVERNRMLGKLWLLSNFNSDMGGAKFTGHMQLGYDPEKKKYVGTWIDTMSPYMQTMEGDYDEKTHTSTFMSTGVDMQTGKKMTSKMITKYEDDDTKHFEMHVPVEGQEGKWFKVMQIDYKRRK